MCCLPEQMLITEYGSEVCTRCGAEDFAGLCSISNGTTRFSVPLHNNGTTYTRFKRFKKYLNRASMKQSACTVPKATWEYLLAGGPYRSPASIVHRLKKAPKSVTKKCYDSLPLLVKMLCPHLRVPALSDTDQLQAIIAFRVLDVAYCEGEPFVSYLYALEYILERIGRGDLLPFINKISCRKRRADYRLRLNQVFNKTRSQL